MSGKMFELFKRKNQYSDVSTKFKQHMNERDDKINQVKSKQLKIQQKLDIFKDLINDHKVHYNRQTVYNTPQYYPVITPQRKSISSIQMQQYQRMTCQLQQYKTLKQQTKPSQPNPYSWQSYNQTRQNNLPKKSSLKKIFIQKFNMKLQSMRTQRFYNIIELKINNRRRKCQQNMTRTGFNTTKTSPKYQDEGNQIKWSNQQLSKRIQLQKYFKNMNQFNRTFNINQTNNINQANGLNQTSKFNFHRKTNSDIRNDSLYINNTRQQDQKRNLVLDDIFDDSKLFDLTDKQNSAKQQTRVKRLKNLSQRKQLRKIPTCFLSKLKQSQINSLSNHQKYQKSQAIYSNHRKPLIHAIKKLTIR